MWKNSYRSSISREQMERDLSELFLESVLMEAGYKVGRYTSPAVFDPLEVWRINQKNIEKERYAELFSKVKEGMRPHGGKRDAASDDF